MLLDWGATNNISVLGLGFFKKNWIPDFLKLQKPDGLRDRICRRFTVFLQLKITGTGFLPKFIATGPDLSGFSIQNRVLIHTIKCKPNNRLIV
jgi:hypothetical protein